MSRTFIPALHLHACDPQNASDSKVLVLAQRWASKAALDRGLYAALAYKSMSCTGVIMLLWAYRSMGLSPGMRRSPPLPCCAALAAGGGNSGVQPAQLYRHPCCSRACWRC